MINTEHTSSYSGYVLVNPTTQPRVEKQSLWGSRCARLAESVAKYAGAHIGGSVGIGYASVHATEITGFVAHRVCGAGILNCWARYSLAAKMMPYIATAGGMTGALVAGVGMAALCKGVEYAANRIVGNSPSLANHQFSMIDIKEET